MSICVFPNLMVNIAAGSVTGKPKCLSKTPKLANKRYPRIQNDPLPATDLVRGGTSLFPQKDRSTPGSSESRRRRSRCSSRIYSSASFIKNQRPRSTSAISRRRSERGGHSISRVLLANLLGSQSPRNAHALTSLPLFCLIEPRSTKSPAASKPVSSSNSRRAATSGFSSSPRSKFPKYPFAGATLPQFEADYFPHWIFKATSIERRPVRIRPWEQA
jgi:hypothetical protein